MVARLNAGTVTLERAVVYEEWMDNAACRDTDPAIFYGETKADVAKAKKICEGCEEKQECLIFTLKREEGGRRYTVAAGMTGRERGALVRKVRKASNGR